MICGFCGKEIDEARAGAACQKCPLGKSQCHLLKCPRCGYENPRTPSFFRRIAAWKNKSERGLQEESHEEYSSQ